MRRRGFLVVLSGPSGAGKNTLLNAVRPQLSNVCYSVSATTRPPRSGERDGEDYFFLADDVFDTWVQRGDFLEWARFAGYRYGTPRAALEERVAAGYTVLLDIDIQGAAQIKAKMPEGVFVFVLPPTLAELRKRLHERGTDAEEVIAQRLAKVRRELEAMEDYDYVILNDDVERAAREMAAIITAERCRVHRSDHRELVAEFFAGGRTTP